MASKFDAVSGRDTCEKEFHQAVSEVLQPVAPVLKHNPQYNSAWIIQRIVEPKRVIMFQVPWVDDQSQEQVNHGFRIEMISSIGPYTGDIGVGARKIGFLFGTYKKMRNEFTGELSGKGLNWDGSRIRPEAIGYGSVYFAAEMLATRNQSLEGKTCLVSGSGDVAQFTILKLLELGARPVTFSDSSGYIYDEAGLDREKLAFLMLLKNVLRAPVSQYVEKYPAAVFTPTDTTADHNPLWNHKADCAFPAATQNEINAVDAKNLVSNSITAVCEGENMPTTPKAIDIFLHAGILTGDIGPELKL
jgi:glutamate dehydrogenase (NADP+)